MIKKFFISMLGSMAALWLSLILLIVMIFIGVAAIGIKVIGGDDLSDRSVLYVNLSGSIEERESQKSFTEIMTYIDSNSDDLASIIRAIRTAANDKQIKGIYINCDQSSLGVASRSEIIDAINDFKKTGKWVYAYADNYEQGDYYVASAADSVYLNPVGMLNVPGLSTNTMFFTDVLEKLGIGITVIRVGSYKSAVEPFMRMDMSPESRHQTEVYLGQIWGDIKSTIAKNRDLASTDIVNMWADSLIFTWDPQRYVQQGAITRLCYRAEVEDAIRKLVDVKPGKDLPTITPAEYLSLKQDDNAKQGSQHIAVLYAVGEIYDSGDAGIVDDDLVPEIRRLAEDDNVKGLVLRVNSPGGSAFASEQIWHALQEFKATKKPFYVSMGDYAASGGYYISCDADVIYCDPATLTGSIGIFGILPNAEKLLKDKIGLGIETVETNPNATFPDYYSTPTQMQVDAMQSYVERGYELFVSHVAQGRSLPADSVKAIGGGRVWDGISAVEIGLADKLGGLNAAIKDMAAELNLDSKDYVCYPGFKAGMLETILKESKKSIEINVAGLTDEQTRQCAECIDKIKGISPVQARMPYIILK